MNKTEEKIPSKFIPFLWHFYKPYKISLSIAFFAYIITVLIDSFFIPFTWKELIAKLMEITDRSHTIEILFYLILSYIGLKILKIILMVVDDLLRRHAIPLVMASANIKLLKHAHNHSYRYFSENFGGSLAGKITDTSDNLNYLYKDVCFGILPAILILCINIVFFLKMDYLLGISLLIWVSLFCIYTKINFPRFFKTTLSHAEARNLVKGKIIDSLTHFLLVKLNSKQKRETSLIKDVEKKEISTNRKEWKEAIKLWLPLNIFSEIFFISLMLVMLYLYSQSRIDLPDITYILMVNNMIFKALFNLTHSLPNFVKGLGRVSRAIDTLLVPFEIDDDPNAKNIRVRHGEIVFDDVSFRYHNKGPWLFKDFNLRIKAGEKIGIVGPSGAGKTTLINLLIRLFDVEKGGIFIDGKNIKEVTQKSLRNSVSAVTQDSELFHRSIKENIGYTKEKASMRAIISAAKKAGAHEFISKFPNKYNTFVGERGIKLSGGQKQRINIARTILKNAPILILDEATSSLDSETESYIHKSFDQIMEGKTTIAIAHRLSTLRMMDRIIIIKDGTIIEEGTHLSLLRKKGAYAKLWDLQSNKMILKEDI